jgi:hypothetical protein
MPHVKLGLHQLSATRQPMIDPPIFFPVSFQLIIQSFHMAPWGVAMTLVQSCHVSPFYPFDFDFAYLTGTLVAYNFFIQTLFEV